MRPTSVAIYFSAQQRSGRAPISTSKAFSKEKIFPPPAHLRKNKIDGVVVLPKPQLAEDHNVVKAVNKLPAEVAAHHLPDLLTHHFSLLWRVPHVDKLLRPNF
ncbi:peptide hydrolase [Trypanosoma cruzi]|nr:peptide hydrolase [Trypanosoma cruzi]